MRLLGFLIVVVGIWMLPVLGAGFPHETPYLIPTRGYAETENFYVKDSLGRFIPQGPQGSIEAMSSAQDGRLSTMLNAKASHVIEWSDLVGWTVFSCIILALGLGMWWLFVRKLYGKELAWISSAILAFMPLFWIEAVTFNNFNFAFFFFAAAAAVFVHLREKNKWVALIAAGILFGLSASSKDVFLICVPWFIGVHLWIGRLNIRQRLLELVVLFGCAGAIYILPYVGDIMKYGYPVNWNLAHFWPGGADIANETYLHFYPDPYTYYFDQEWFNEHAVRQASEGTWLHKIQAQKVFRGYGVGEWSFIKVLLHGLWLFSNSFWSLVIQSKMGGFILWILILPGFFAFAKQDKRALYAFWGLIIAAYAVITFLLGYNREHLMDFIWVLALTAAFGVVSVSAALTTHIPRYSKNTISIVVTLIVCLHLLQVNRHMFARMYSRPAVPDTVAVAMAIAELPEDAVVALPMSASLSARIAGISGRTIAIFKEDTVKRLAEQGKVQEAFETYEITHMIRYHDLRIPGIEVVEVDEGKKKVHVSRFLTFLLHIID